MSHRKRAWRAAGLAITAVLLAAGLIWGLSRPGEGSQGVLYRVTRGDKVMYLLGSIHIGNDAMYPFGEEILAAMDKAQRFVYECDTDSQTAVADMRRRMAATAGETLRESVGAALDDELTQVCDQLGLDRAALDGLKPWAVINTLAVYTTAAEIGSDNVGRALSLGVEKKVRAYADSHGKTAAYLETLDEQIGVLESFSPELTRYLLQGECDAILRPESARSVDKTIAQWPDWWRAGDAEAFAAHYLGAYLEPGHETEGAEYHQKLITRRNQAMTERLMTLLAEEPTCFVTVGLLHLVLPQDGIARLLRERGCEVTQICNP